MAIYHARMMIGHLPTYTDGEFETAVAAINEVITEGMTDQSSSGESDLYTLPILCMLNFHLQKHAKIDTILWHPSYDVEKDFKETRADRVKTIWVEDEDGDVVPATV